MVRKQASERQAEPESTTVAVENELSEDDTLDSSVENSSETAALPASDSVPGPDSNCQPAPKADPTWLPAVEYFQAGQTFSIGDICLNTFTIPHDAADPVGFVFSSEGVRMGFATDLGYIAPNVREQLRALDLLLIESNHDLEMLRDGPYPWSVKQRVLSRVGHLSNDATSEFLSEDYDGQAKYIILGHLSENNNLPELARVAAERALSGRASLLANRLLLASQNEPLSAITF
jgi:phosphoribosyl 1,2-cyclic phosphodiesterase